MSDQRLPSRISKRYVPSTGNVHRPILWLVLGLFFVARQAKADPVLVSQDLGTSAYSASATYNPVDWAFDGDSTTYWNAPGYAPQWIQVDLGQVYNIAEIDLQVSQTPDGDTSSEVFISDNPIGWNTDSLTPVATFTGYTVNNQWLYAPLSPTVAGQYVEVLTTSSPSWIGWDEVQVFAQQAGVPEPSSLVLGAIGILVTAIRLGLESCPRPSGWPRKEPR